MKAITLCKKSALALCALVCALLLAGCLTGCADEEKAVKEAVSAELDQFKNIDDETLKVFNDAGGSQLTNLGIDSNEFVKTWMDGFSYEIGEVTMGSDKKTADVKVKITSKKLVNAMTSWETHFTEWIETAPASTSYDDALAKGGSMLMDEVANAEPVTTDVVLKVTKTDKGWVVDENDNAGLYEAVLGDYSSILK